MTIFIIKQVMTLDQFKYAVVHHDFLRTFLVVLVLYIIIMIPLSKGDMQPEIIKSIFYVFVGICIIWMIGNFDVVLGTLGIR